MSPSTVGKNNYEFLERILIVGRRDKILSPEVEERLLEEMDAAWFMLTPKERDEYRISKCGYAKPIGK